MTCIFENKFYKTLYFIGFFFVYSKPSYILKYFFEDMEYISQIKYRILNVVINRDKIITICKYLSLKKHGILGKNGIVSIPKIPKIPKN